MIDIVTPDGVADAYLARPSSGARAPGVLLIMDAFGLREQIHVMAERIAVRGHVVLAPNVFYRSGRAPMPTMPDLSQPGARESFFKEVGSLMAQLTPEAVTRDGGAYLEQLEQLAGTPLAITGYCMGVRVALTVAVANPDRVVAVGGFHAGRLVTDAPDSPHRSLSGLRAEVYLGYADQDPSMSAKQITQFDRALESEGVPHRSEVYAGAAHGYTMADTPVYDQAAAERHFRALFDLLDRRLAWA